MTDAKAVFQKILCEAMRLAALGASYERVGNTLGFVKSMLIKWLRNERGIALASAGSL